MFVFVLTLYLALLGRCLESSRALVLVLVLARALALVPA